MNLILDEVTQSLSDQTKMLVAVSSMEVVANLQRVNF